MTSAVFGIRDILVAHAAGRKRVLSWGHFMNALLKGDHEMFRIGDVPEVINVYQVNENVRQSPLLGLRILHLLATTCSIC